MKAPLKWIGEFVDLPADAEEIARRLTAAGVEVENIERARPAFSGVVVARVLRHERHPNADRLSLCDVDAGAAGRFQVVCGAPNARTGMVAALARVGARLGGAPPLQAAVIRGVRSEGMLCSERELGLSAEHEGILELDADAPPGLDLADHLGLDETVLDIAITPNRGDCLSIIGIAREIAALFGARLKLRKPSPARSPKADGSAAASLTIDIKAPDLCPRYAALEMAGLKIGPSPAPIRRRLELCGMRALNNVVDATNYVMLELGQPLHAFDRARIGGAAIVVRRAGADREFVTLDRVARRLEPDDLVIADAKRPIALAGIMGGLDSEVDDSTAAIVLESACFAPLTVARTARRLTLRSEASYRFERGIDRNGQVRALSRVAELLAAHAGAGATAPIYNSHPRPVTAKAIALDFAAMAAMLGVKIPAAEVRRRLAAVGATVTGTGTRLRVTPPAFRPDLTAPADLAEEVVRLRGLKEIPARMPTRLFSVAPPDPRREFLAATREAMLGSGLSEVKTLAFTNAADNREFPGSTTGTPVRVNNPLSPETAEMRMSLIPGLLATLRFNLNREATALHIFEIARVYAMRDGAAIEAPHLGALGYGDWGFGGVGHRAIKAGFFTMKGILENYFRALGIADAISFSATHAAAFLHPGRAAIVSLAGRPVGIVGELHPRAAMARDLAGKCVLCELDLSEFISYGLSPHRSIQAPPKFPAVRRDLALVVDRETPAERVVSAITELKPALLEAVEVFDVYEGDSIAAGKKSVALACRYRARDRTLTDEEVNRAHAAVVEQACARLGAELRR